MTHSQSTSHLNRWRVHNLPQSIIAAARSWVLKQPRCELGSRHHRTRWTKAQMWVRDFTLQPLDGSPYHDVFRLDWTSRAEEFWDSVGHTKATMETAFAGLLQSLEESEVAGRIYSKVPDDGTGLRIRSIRVISELYNLQFSFSSREPMLVVLTLSLFLFAIIVRALDPQLHDQYFARPCLHCFLAVINQCRSPQLNSVYLKKCLSLPKMEIFPSITKCRILVRYSSEESCSPPNYHLRNLCMSTFSIIIISLHILYNLQ